MVEVVVVVVVVSYCTVLGIEDSGKHSSNVKLQDTLQISNKLVSYLRFGRTECSSSSSNSNSNSNGLHKQYAL